MISVSSPTQADKPQRMTAEARREQLLDVTKRLVIERGFHAVSIEAVAREAGISRPIVYGHFRDLATLLEALTEREGARALMQLADVLPQDLGEGNAVEKLLAGLRAYLEVARADPGTWGLVLMPQEGAPDVLRERIASGRAAVIAQLAEVIRPGLESPDPELTAATFSVFADESVRLMLTNPERYPVERIMNHARWLLDLAVAR
jgi:AcrR family transcriptional regulator